MSKGPLAVRWGAVPAAAPQAGTTTRFRVEVENAGSIAWGDGVFVSYHWLDDRDNPIVWDGIRTPAGRSSPASARRSRRVVRAPIPPGRYRLAFDLVAEQRAWFSELGSPMLTQDVDVLPRTGEPNAALPGWRRAGARTGRSALRPRTPRATASSRARSTGRPAVSAAARARSRRTSPAPDASRASRARCSAPSVLPGIELEPLGEVGGLPAFAAPADEPWVYDGRIVLRVRR